MKKEKNAPKETPVEDVPAAAENTETKPSASVAKERPAKVTKEPLILLKDCVFAKFTLKLLKTAITKRFRRSLME